MDELYMTIFLVREKKIKTLKWQNVYGGGVAELQREKYFQCFCHKFPVVLRRCCSRHHFMQSKFLFSAPQPVSTNFFAQIILGCMEF